MQELNLAIRENVRLRREVRVALDELAAIKELLRLAQGGQPMQEPKMDPTLNRIIQFRPRGEVL